MLFAREGGELLAFIDVAESFYLLNYMQTAFTHHLVTRLDTYCVITDLFALLIEITSLQFKHKLQEGPFLCLAGQDGAVEKLISRRPTYRK